MSSLFTPDPDVVSDEEQDHELDAVRQQIASALFPRNPRSSEDIQRIGRFVVEQRLGAGAMGVVYAARDPDLDRRVAIKLVRPESGGDPRAQGRLQREARALAKVSHPNIVAIHEVGEHRGQVFLAMEHVQGPNLRAWQEQGLHTPAEVLGMYLQAGRGLAAAHVAGLVHRDFKPENVLLDETGRARVVDFGLVGHDEVGRRSELERWSTTISSTLVITRTCSLVGTPAYMSPEQLEGGEVDHRSDQFGFCVALYEALHGQHPFDDTSLTSLRRSVLGGRLRPPPKRSPVPVWIHRLLVRGLAVAPDDRHVSLDALLDALSRDPAAMRRRWLAVGGLVLAVSVVTYTLARQGVDEPRARCERAADELTALWKPERRAAIGEAMAAAGSSYGRRAWAQVEPGLEAYSIAWAEARTGTCMAYAAGLESDRQHDLRVACLARRHAAFEALLEVLVEPTHEDVVNASLAVASLPSIASCADIEALTSALPPPEEPEVAAAVEGHRYMLARVHEYEVLGRFDQARALANAVLGSAEATAYPPLEAEALLALGALELASWHYEAADAVLSRALEVGLRIDHVEVAAEAFARRIFTTSVTGHEEDALRELPLARALVERTGDDQLRWLLLNNSGAAYYSAGRYPEAKQRFLAALEVKRRVHGEEHYEYANTLGNLAGTANVMGDGKARRAFAVQSLEIKERLLGSEHPLVASAELELARTDFFDGRLDAARARIPAAISRLEATSGSDSEVVFHEHILLAGLSNMVREHAEALDYIDRTQLALQAHDLDGHQLRLGVFTHRAVALEGLGRRDEAWAELERGLAFVEQAFEPPAKPTSVHLAMVRLLLGRGEVDEALAVARRMPIMPADDDVETHLVTAEIRLEVAKALHARGELVKALSEASRAYAELIVRQPHANYASVDFRLVLGGILLDLERPAEAIAQYELGHRGLARTAEPHNPQLAKLELAIARALLWPHRAGDGIAAEDRARAETLARTALASFRRYSPRFAVEAEAAEELLARSR
jgi:tetratricopeptide (TPR) repeat protein/predicted Ser/Thr protein kinase